MRDLSWKQLASEYLLRDTWATVRKDTCRTNDGKIIDPYYVYEFPTWVTAVALTTDGKMILERQYRYALDLTSFEIPGGCVDDSDSTTEEAIARELLEETGYRFSEYTYLGKTSSNPSTNSNWMHMYLATGGEKVQDQQLDHNEDIEVHLFSINEVKTMLERNEIFQSMHVTALYYGLARMKAL